MTSFIYLSYDIHTTSYFLAILLTIQIIDQLMTY